MGLRTELKHAGFLFNQGHFGKIFDHLKENVAFDVKHGTETSLWLNKEDFAHQPKNFEHGVRYRASSTKEIRRALEMVAKLISPKDASYYDLGCGKGKTLCIAGMDYDYKILHGVDYYQPFLDLAQTNLNRCNVDNVKLHYGDMREFSDYDETSVIFLYNPADNVIIDAVRENLEHYTKRAIVVYNKPEHETVFLRNKWQLVDRKTSLDPDHNTSVYSFGF